MALSKMPKMKQLCVSRHTLTRSFKRTLKNERNNPSGAVRPCFVDNTTPEMLTFSNIWKPFGFTLAFTGTSFIGASIWEYESFRAHAIKMMKKNNFFFQRREKKREWKYTKEVQKWWNGLSQGEKVFVPICTLNILVFGAWKIPRLKPFMYKWFCSSPSGKNICLPMFLSTFSHYSALHLLTNMYVLHSFSTGAAHSLGKEQFLALYTSSGVISSFTSHLYKIITKQPGLSVGASGAIMAIIGYVCTQHPDTRLGIILLPVFTFSASTAVKSILALDTAGMILKWRFFDHAAHLGGMIFGIYWAMQGNEKIWRQREPALEYWHALRGAIK